MITFKDYMVDQIHQMGFEDHDGNYYEAQEIKDRFDEFVKQVEQQDLAEMIIDFTEQTTLVNGKIVVRPEVPYIKTSKWVDAIIGIDNFSK